MPRDDDAFLELVQERSFRYFIAHSNPANGLTRDRAPTPSFASIAAVGFALTAYPIGVERGWLLRADAADRVLTTLRFLWEAPQGPDPAGMTGYRGFFYHFLDMETGHRHERVELSTIDTALLMAGVLFCQQYFNGPGTGEMAIREYADSLYRRVEWPWAQVRAPLISIMRGRGIDYFENSRRALHSQRAYAQANPGGWRGYGGDLWGLMAGDGPLDATLVIDGVPREFRTYWARGASFTEVADDGTLVPTALGGSIPFDPELTVAGLRAMKERYGDYLFGEYGFLDAFNLTLRTPVTTQHGRVVPGVGWFDTDYLGIDQGPFVAMIENHRSELVWRLMRENPYVVEGLRRAGFTGGWLGP